MSRWAKTEEQLDPLLIPKHGSLPSKLSPDGMNVNSADPPKNGKHPMYDDGIKGDSGIDGASSVQTACRHWAEKVQDVSVDLSNGTAGRWFPCPIETRERPRWPLRGTTCI